MSRHLVRKAARGRGNQGDHASVPRELQGHKPLTLEQEEHNARVSARRAAKLARRLQRRSG